MKRPAKPLWDRQGFLIFVRSAPDRLARPSPLKHSLPARSSPHSKKTVQHGSRTKKI